MANAKGAAIIWPWFLGSYLAVQCGADNPSPARTITGWVFEAAWLACLGALLSYYLLKKRSVKRSAAGWLASAQAAEREPNAEKSLAEAADAALDNAPETEAHEKST
jgi:hypothetical protein